MDLIGLAVKKPITIAMFSIIIILAGIFSLFHLPLELTPNVDFPRLSITTTWPDSSPEMVEAFVTSPIEAAVNTVNHIHSIRSTTIQGSSVIDIEFVRGTDMNFAAMELNEKISMVREDLPYGAYEPRVSKYVPDEFKTDSFFSIRLTGNYTLQELRRIGTDRIAPVLAGIEGVTHIDVTGGKDRVLEIIVDRDAVNLYGVSLGQIRMKLMQLGYRQSAGVIYDDNTRLNVLIDTPVQDIAHIENAVLAKQGNSLVRIRDVARVQDTYGRPRNISRINGLPAIVIQIKREAGSNVVQVAGRIKDNLKALERKLPGGLRMIVDTDQSVPIRENLANLGRRAVFSVFVIFIILYLFIHSYRAPLIILSTIFLSTLLTIFMFFICHISLNLLTLAGLALGFGMLVDNAIVVVENVFRHQRNGLSIYCAAETGTREVMLPIVASTMTTLAAFIPFLYLTGELRIYYLPFTMAVGFALVSSLAIAFTVSPCLIARIPIHSPCNEETESRSPVKNAYTRILSSIVKQRFVTIGAAAVILGLSIYVFDKYVTKGKLFEWGNSKTLAVYVGLPKGAQLERADALIRIFEDEALKTSFVEKTAATVSAEFAYLRITFPPSVQNSSGPYILKEQLIGKASLVAGAGVHISGYGEGYSNGSGFSIGASYRIKLLGYNYKKLDAIAGHIAKRLKQYVRVRNINTNMSVNYYQDKGKEMVLHVDRKRLNQYNMPMDYFLYNVQAFLRESLAWQRIRFNGAEVDYLLKFRGYNTFSIRDFMQSTINTPGGEHIRISQVASLEQREIMPEIVRENQQYMRIVGFEFRGPAKMGNRLLETIIETTRVPPGFKAEKQTYWFLTDKEEKEIHLILIISLILVFMVTAALFESLLHPFLILLTVPLSLAGVFFLFYITNSPFDRSAYIGVVLLCGIVVNDSILLVDHINRMRTQGLNMTEAAITGAAHRMRPILMTTFTTVGGLLPLVLLVHDKNDLWYSLALATIGGLISSTLMVLTVIPALYIIFETIHTKAQHFLSTI